ncbi:hypothetical protein AGR8A_Cc30298 [Agrobacterium fabrum str. J-07]|nr:hypothetical protein AGR8A_Cc30298 [Agrobacterium fabrum str. J-07]
MTRDGRKPVHSRFPGPSSGWVARGGMQMPSQMNGCHVPGQTGAIQNPAYRPTGEFSFSAPEREFRMGAIIPLFHKGKVRFSQRLSAP